ncbi:MAG: CDP-alcohol phosphatidyltransferase family protein [Candidatus Omnitrophica bacterium]|nr:CDP-alcohol phosphatidyltransferase family protein [Candidatus Omnitrophota bacterium]
MKNISRPVSIYLTRLFIMTPLTGNQITVLFIIMGLCASLFFLRGTPVFILAGALLLQVWYIFDMVDGEVARYKKQTSVTGIYFDKITHYIVHPCIFFCIGMGLYAACGTPGYLYLGFIGSLSTVLISVVWDMREAVLFGQSKRIKADSAEETQSVSGTGIFKKLFMRLHILCVFPSVMNIITILAIFGFFMNMHVMKVFLPAYAFCATLIWLARLIVFVKTKKIDHELQG